MSRKQRGMVLSGSGKYSVGKFVKNMRQLGISKRTNRITDVALDRAIAATANPMMMQGMGAYSARRTMEGRGAYSARRTLSGRGAYEAPVVNESELSLGTRFAPPTFGAGGGGHDDGGMIIRHQEFVQNIYGNETGESFSSFSFDVNPGLSSVTPLLSQVASSFQKYRMRQMAFHFESQLDGTVLQSTTGQVGDVYMYSHTDIQSEDFQNTSEFRMNGGSSTRVTKGLICGVECDPAQLAGLPNAGINYVRTAPVDDATQYDQARFQFAVSNTPSDLAGQIVGRLYVSYSVELIRPRIWPLIGRSQLQDVFVSNRLEGSYPAGPAPFLGETWYSLSTNSMNCLFTYGPPEVGVAESFTITLPSWLQGVVTLFVWSDQASGGVPSLTDPPQYSSAFSYTLGGEVTRVELNPALGQTSGELIDGGTSWMNDSGIRQDGGLFVAFRQRYRVSPALTEDNTIKLINKQYTSYVDGDMKAISTTIIVSIDTDYETVGTESFATKATLVAL